LIDKTLRKSIALMKSTLMNFDEVVSSKNGDWILEELLTRYRMIIHGDIYLHYAQQTSHEITRPSTFVRSTCFIDRYLKLLLLSYRPSFTIPVWRICDCEEISKHGQRDDTKSIAIQSVHYVKTTVR
jgi:hypothetical protein